MKSLRLIGRIFYIIAQLTWGFLQTVFGFVLFLRYAKCRHEIFHGAVLTYHNGNFGGVSLGLFIFVNGSRGDNWINDARVHEFGHTIQSLLFGPFYLLVIGLPSVVWCNADRFRKLREEMNVAYNSFYIEKNAEVLGSKISGEPLPEWKD